VSLTTQRARKRAQYRLRKALGQCVGCGGDPRPDMTTCASCGAKQAERNRKYQHRIIPAFRKLRVCLHCHLNIPVHGQQVCGVCAEAQADRQAKRRAERKRNGLCPVCGNARDRQDRALCTPCRLASNRHSAQSKARLRRHGRYAA